MPACPALTHTKLHHPTTPTLRGAHAPTRPQARAHSCEHTKRDRWTRRPRTLGRTAGDTLRHARSRASRPPACTPARCPPRSLGRVRGHARPARPESGWLPRGPASAPSPARAGPIRSGPGPRPLTGSRAGSAAVGRTGARSAGAVGPTRVGGAAAARSSAGFRRRLRGPARALPPLPAAGPRRPLRSCALPPRRLGGRPGGALTEAGSPHSPKPT